MATIASIARRDVLVAPADLTVAAAARRMAERRCGSIVVVADGCPIGIWTERDACALTLDAPGSLTRPLSAVMSAPVHTVPEDGSLADAALALDELGVRRMVVVDGGGRAVGLLSQTDIVRFQEAQAFFVVRPVRDVVQGAPLRVAADTPVAEAVARMRDHHAEAILVGEDDDLGILTERDVVRLIATGRTDRTAGALASRPVISVPSTRSVLAARDLMTSRDVRHLVVVADNGEIQGVLGLGQIMRAIEHSFVAEMKAELDLSERRYTALFEQNRAVQLLIDPETGVIVDANPAACRFYGHDRSRLRGMRIQEINILPPEDVRLEMQRAALEQRDHFLFRHRLADGDIRDVEVRSGPIELGGRMLLYSIIHDVTDRRQAETALRREHDLMESIFLASPHAIVVAGADGVVHTVNARAREILEPAALVADRVETLAWRITAVDGGPFAVADLPFRRVLATGAPVFDVRHALLWPDGRRRVLAVNGAPLFDDQGMVADVVLTVQDITASVEGETARAELVAILEATPDFVSMSDVQGELLYLSAGARRMTGVAPSAPGAGGRDIPPGLCQGFAHPDWARRRLDEVAVPTARAEGLWRGESAVIGADGREIPVSQVVLAHRDPDGRVRRLSTILRDISERKHLEDLLRERLHFQEHLLQSLPMAVFVKDLEGVYTECNDTFAAFAGRGREDILGRTIHDFAAPEIAGAEAADDHRCWAEGSRTYETRVRHLGDDRLRHVMVSKTVYCRPDGSPAGLIGALIDLSDRVEAEQRLADSNRELEQFAYAISHDLQEPLRMISSYLALLERRHGDRLGDEGREFMDFAVDGARRLHRMIQDLLDYSRVTTRGGEPAPVAADQALDRALDNLALVIEETGAEIVRKPLPRVRADIGQLARLFQNLVANALHHRHPERTPRVEIGATWDGRRGRWRFTVADNGPGIPAGAEERIFEVFRRLDNNSAGTGVGLAVSKRIVERHGGTIRVDSVEGTGSTFAFTLADADPA